MRGPRGTADGVGGRGTTPPPPARILDVTGGSGDLAATYAEVLTLAHRFDVAADHQERWVTHSRRVASDPDLLESSLLSPRTAAIADAAVWATVVALRVDATGWHNLAGAVCAAVGLIREADDVARFEVDAVDYQLGRAVGFSLVRLPWVTGWTVAGLTLAGMASDRTLTDHPTLVTHLMNGSGGVVDGVAAGLGLPLLFTPRVRDAARLAAATYGDEGRPVVRPVGVGLVGDATQPASVRGLVSHLGDLAGLSEGSHASLNGTIQVQTITGADGRVRHVVYLPGTDDLTTTPWSQDQDVRDMATNEQLMAGQDDTSQQGILQAMHDAGVRPGEPVALVGHSQGGMEAAALLAHQAGGAGHLTITDVVTAGSPTAQVGAFPDGSHVLSLEQRGDIVPLLDGRAPQDSVAQTTVTFDAGPDGGVLAHHSYSTYVAGAGAVDVSTDPSVQASVASLHDHGFLGDGSGVTVTSQVFQITRG